jgi:hypothetical protein
MNDERRPEDAARRPIAATDDTNGARRARPSAAERLAIPGAVLSRTDFRELGWERRAIDCLYRALPVIVLPGYSRPIVRAEDYLKYVAEHTYRDDRVRVS